MLTGERKRILEDTTIFRCSSKDKNGKPVTFYGTEFIIPSFPEIKEEICKKILKLGFSNVEIVKPSKANCIIRVFQKLHYKYEDNQIYSLYGAFCYVRSANGFEHQQSILDYSECVIRYWMFQDEYIDFNCDFFDCYVKIK